MEIYFDPKSRTVRPDRRCERPRQHDRPLWQGGLDNHRRVEEEPATLAAIAAFDGYDYGPIIEAYNRDFLPYLAKPRPGSEIVLTLLMIANKGVEIEPEFEQNFECAIRTILGFLAIEPLSKPGEQSMLYQLMDKLLESKSQVLAAKTCLKFQNEARKRSVPLLSASAALFHKASAVISRGVAPRPAAPASLGTPIIRDREHGMRIAMEKEQILAQAREVIFLAKQGQVEEKTVMEVFRGLAQLEAISGDAAYGESGASLCRQVCIDVGQLAVLLKRDDQILIDILEHALSAEIRNEQAQSRGNGPRERWVEAATQLGRITMMEVRMILSKVALSDISEAADAVLVEQYLRNEAMTSPQMKRLCEIAEQFGELPARAVLLSSLQKVFHGYTVEEFSAHMKASIDKSIFAHREQYILYFLFEDVNLSHPDSY